MFKVDDIVKVKNNPKDIWIIVKESWTPGHYIIKDINSTIDRGVWDNNLIGYGRIMKIKKICSRLEKNNNE